MQSILRLDFLVIKIFLNVSKLIIGFRIITYDNKVIETKLVNLELKFLRHTEKMIK